MNNKLKMRLDQSNLFIDRSFLAQASTRKGMMAKMIILISILFLRGKSTCFGLQKMRKNPRLQCASAHVPGLVEARPTCLLVPGLLRLGPKARAFEMTDRMTRPNQDLMLALQIELRAFLLISYHAMLEVG